MLDSGVELITLIAGINYEPTFVSTDKRVPAGTPTSLGYLQIGEIQQYGFAKGPIFKVGFLDVSIVSASHVKIWGISNKNNDAPLFPISYFTLNPDVTVYLKKFIFCDAFGVEVVESDYTVIGYKKSAVPLSW